MRNKKGYMLALAAVFVLSLATVNVIARPIVAEEVRLRAACCVAVPPHSFEVVDACRRICPHDGISRAVLLGCYFGRK